VYQQSDAAGFIRLYGLPNRVRALKDAELGYVPRWGSTPPKDAETPTPANA
jgi:hypothetical protein